MGFFGIGAGEILLILIVILIVLGPHRIPEIARTLGKAMRTLKKASFDLTSAVTKEIEASEDNSPASKPKEEINANTAAPSASGKATIPDQDEQPTTKGEAPPKND